MSAASEPLVRPSRAEAFRFWVKLGFASFGGAPAQIAMMHAELVSRRRWISETRFRHDLALCQSLPGPEAQQLATLTARRLHGYAAGFFAGAAFVIPGTLLVLLAGLFLPGADRLAPLWLGLRVGALALLLPSAWKMLLRHPEPKALAFAAFGAAASLGGVPQPLIALSAGLAGWKMFKDAAGETESRGEGGFPWRLAGIASLAVVAPAALAALVLGARQTVVLCAVVALRIGWTGFGGAYAVAPEAFRLFAQIGAAPHGLAADATTIAEAVPGPFLLVVQHGAFATAHAHPDGLTPAFAGILASLLAAWSLFASSTSIVLMVSPVADRLTGKPGLRAAMTGVGAAAAGQIAGLVVPVAIAACPSTWPLRAAAALILAAGMTYVIRFPRLAWTSVPLCGLLGWAFVH